MPKQIERGPSILRAYAILVTVVVVVVGWICWFNSRTTVLLVRHAEKGAATNANLTTEGLDRADELVAVASEAGVSAVYATEWCRTAQTAQPLADALGLTIQVQQHSHPEAGLAACDPAVPAGLYSLLPPENDTTAELADEILAANQGKVVLVVGHSNTVPELVDRFGGGSFDPVGFGEAFDRLFVVSLYRYFLGPQLIKARYGRFSCADGAQATCPP